jgi:hypothetical protein
MAVAYKIGSEERRQMISEAAYYRAERRGFQGDHAQADWFAAEREVDAMLSGAEDAWLEGLEEFLASVSKRIQEQKRKIARMKIEARAEWQEELQALGKLRDAFARKLGEIREEGQTVGQAARRQADQIYDELSSAVQRLSARQKRK